MNAKRTLLLMLICCLLLTGCAGKTAEEVKPQEQPSAEAVQETPAEEAPQAEPAASIFPLPDTTMDNLSDAILAISLAEGDAYVDDKGIMQMHVKIYSYDKYDMVDIAMLKEGDILYVHDGEIPVNSLERKDDGTILINGGLDNNGLELVTDEGGIFFESGYNDAKNWYEVGEATIRVSVDFQCSDTSDLDQGEVIYYPGSFLVGEVTNFYFSPYNTTIRVENGQIVEMTRVYMP